MKAVDTHRISASSHYTKVISDLERHWGRAAFNFKIRLESEKFLENSDKHKEKLLAYLTAQGGSTEFPSMRIENAKGETIISYEYVASTLPKTKFLPDQESTWVMDSATDRLFLVIRQLIWLGDKNGYLLVFRPMDHALLNQISYPKTRLSLWWNDKAVASSDGDDGLLIAGSKFKNLGNDRSIILLPWAGIETVNSPKLLVESIAPPLLDIAELAVILAVIISAFVSGVWLILGAWGLGTVRRIQAVERAQTLFQTSWKIDEEIDRDLKIGRGDENDEITSLAESAEQLMKH